MAVTVQGGDRSGLFAALLRTWAPPRALYPGSYLDLSPSTAIASATYVDTDRRAARFFVDQQKVEAELAGRTGAGAGAEVTFLNADYTTALPLRTAGFDLLISLYAGLVLDHCRQYLTPGGLLLANTSHGDASLAAFDPRDEYGLDREAAGSDARMMARRLAVEEGLLAGTSSLGSGTPACPCPPPGAPWSCCVRLTG